MALASGATESSRSRMMPSAARLRPFSSARAFDPGMNSRLRRGRIMTAFLSDFEPDAITFQPVVRKPCARRLPHLHLGAAAHRAIALPRTVGARSGPRGDGDRLLRFPGLAGGDLRR